MKGLAVRLTPENLQEAIAAYLQQHGYTLMGEVEYHVELDGLKHVLVAAEAPIAPADGKATRRFGVTTDGTIRLG